MTIEYVDPNTLKPFPYSEDLFPPLNGDAYKLLKEDIKEHGIRTPLEVTKGNIILCGHERRRVALELELKEVPVTYFSDKNIIEQKIRCIKDNLARKEVAFRTKVKCYNELKTLYGLKDGQRKTPEVSHRKSSEAANSEALAVSQDTRMSQDEIAHEVGFSAETMNRAEAIEKSDLPDLIKAAAFDGRLSIRPVSELAKEKDQKVKAQVVQETLKRIEQGDIGFSVETLLNDTRHNIQVADLMEQAGIPPVDQQIEEYFAKVKPKPQQDDIPIASKEDYITMVKSIMQDHAIQCKICGDTKIVWSCGHDFT